VAGNEHVDAMTNRAMDALEGGREASTRVRHARAPVQA
jgi:hypothetical protein